MNTLISRPTMMAAAGMDERKALDPPRRIAVCESWKQEICCDGNKCRRLHSWYHGSGFRFLTHLDGHDKTITSIVLPSGSHNLYTGSLDGTVRVWNCNTGQCDEVIVMDSEVGCLFSEGPWMFAGLSDAVKVWNISTGAKCSLGGPGGLVRAIQLGYGKLFAGSHDGTITSWEFNPEVGSFKRTAKWKGHCLAVTCLAVGVNHMLFSGSMDNTIKRWELRRRGRRCVQTLTGHCNAVMSLLGWDRFLLSCSLEGKLKFWAMTKEGHVCEHRAHFEYKGMLAIRTMTSVEGKPILLCSRGDNTVRLYELPSFREIGTMFSRKEVRAIEIGPGGLFFTGDASGRIYIWKSGTH